MAFDTYLLNEAIARRRAIEEHERQATLTQSLHILDKLASRYGISRAYIFGSITRPGQFRPDSDVDIAVEIATPEHFFEAMSVFALTLGREVDLIELEKCHFAHRIQEEGIEWTKTLSPF